MVLKTLLKTWQSLALVQKIRPSSLPKYSSYFILILMYNSTLSNAQNSLYNKKNITSSVESVSLIKSKTISNNKSKEYIFRIVVMPLEYVVVNKGIPTYKNFITGKFIINDSIHFSIPASKNKDTTYLSYSLKKKLDTTAIIYTQFLDSPVDKEFPQKSLVFIKSKIRISFKKAFKYEGDQVYKISLDSIGVYLPTHRSDGFVILYTAKKGVIGTYNNYVGEYMPEEWVWNFTGDKKLLEKLIKVSKNIIPTITGPSEQ